jgi:hypothetical protein
MTSACIEGLHSHPCKCTAKPSVGNGVLQHDAESQPPRRFGAGSTEARLDRVDRPHVKSAGVRYSVISEGYRYVTWYRLLLLVTVSITLTMMCAVRDSENIFGDFISLASRKCLESLNYLGSFIIQASMRPVKSGILASVALSSCGVVGNTTVGNERVVNQTYDVFDYIDPLIGTINGGGYYSFNIPTVTDMSTGHVFPGATLPFGERTPLGLAKSC